MTDNNNVMISKNDLKFYESFEGKLNQSEKMHRNYMGAVVLICGIDKHFEISRKAASLTAEDQEKINHILDTSEERYKRT